MEINDQIGRPLFFKDTPKRIVSLVPSQTELLYDLGLETSIVGITKFCVHPKHLKANKTIVGGTKQVDFTKISALKPDIILCNKEENTLEMVQNLTEIAPTHVSDIYSIKDCCKLIEMYGAIFNVKSDAKVIVEKINEELHSFNEFISDKPKRTVVYFIWKNPWMVAASNTFIDYMLALNHFDNFYKNFDRYPEIILEKEPNKNVDLILLSSEPYPFKEPHIVELKSFFPLSKVVLVDGEMFSWYGTRLLKAFHYFKALHQKDLN